jgi:alpha/beta superfamily hydrolase
MFFAASLSEQLGDNTSDYLSGNSFGSQVAAKLLKRIPKKYL